MSLYLKYRPQDFDSIIWQEQVKDILKAEIEKNLTTHSYIFFWPRWTWKTSTARIFAKALNCLSEWKKPCNKCENCKLINEWKTLDLVEIDAASNTQVDKIREEIIDKAIYPPTTLRKKVYIIDEVHMLSKSAFNALLKIMEEPPEYLVFILATTELHKVPETIISRCEVFNFKRISKEQIVNHLKYICEKEWFNYTEWWLELIAKISDWWLRDAIKYLEQVSIIGEINEENVSKFLWIAPEKEIKDFLNILQNKDISNIYAFIEKLQENWVDLINFAKSCLLYLNEHLLEDLNKNLELVRILDKVYQNFKNFPSVELAYKATIWEELCGLNNSNPSLIKEEKSAQEKLSDKDITNNDSEIKETEEKVEETKEKTEEKVEETEEKTQISFWKKISKNELLENIESPIVKWIIKNFGEIEQINDNLRIIIISQTNYTILNQKDKLKDLEKAINKIDPNLKFEVIYIPKEEYFMKKINQ